MSESMLASTKHQSWTWTAYGDDRSAYRNQELLELAGLQGPGRGTLQLYAVQRVMQADLCLLY